MIINSAFKKEQNISKTIFAGVLLFFCLCLIGFLITNPFIKAKAKCWTDHAVNTTYCVYQGSQHKINQDLDLEEVSHR